MPGLGLQPAPCGQQLVSHPSRAGKSRHVPVLPGRSHGHTAGQSWAAGPRAWEDHRPTCLHHDPSLSALNPQCVVFLWVPVTCLFTPHAWLGSGSVRPVRLGLLPAHLTDPGRPALPGCGHNPPAPGGQGTDPKGQRQAQVWVGRDSGAQEAPWVRVWAGSAAGWASHTPHSPSRQTPTSQRSKASSFKMHMHSRQVPGLLLQKGLRPI